MPSDDTPDTTTWQCTDCGRKRTALTPNVCPRCGSDDLRPVDVDVPGGERGEVQTEAFDVRAATASLDGEAADGTRRRPSLLRRLVRGILRR